MISKTTDDNTHRNSVYAIELVNSSITNNLKNKLDPSTTKEVAEEIRALTGWKIPVDEWSIKEYMVTARSQAEVNEQRLREESDSKFLKRGKTTETMPNGKFCEDEGVSQRSEEKKINGRLQSPIEKSVDAYKILKILLNSKVDLTLREILGIARKEMLDLIIDKLKRKKDKCCRHELCITRR